MNCYGTITNCVKFKYEKERLEFYKLHVKPLVYTDKVPTTLQDFLFQIQNVNLVHLLLHEHLYSPPSKTLQKILGSTTLKQYIERNMMQLETVQEWAKTLNMLHHVKHLLAFTISAEEQLCTTVFNLMWHKLGYVSIYDLTKPNRPLAIHVVQHWNRTYPEHPVRFALDDHKRNIRQWGSNQNVIAKNSNVTHVLQADFKHVLNTCETVLQFWKMYQKKQKKSDLKKIYLLLAAYIQLATGCRHNEVYMSNFIPLSKKHVKQLQNVFTDFSIPDCDHIIAVFRYGKGEVTNVEFHDKVEVICRQIQTTLYDYIKNHNSEKDYRTSERYVQRNGRQPFFIKTDHIPKWQTYNGIQRLFN